MVTLYAVNPKDEIGVPLNESIGIMPLHSQLAVCLAAGHPLKTRKLFHSQKPVKG
jgi:hypothetical protein